MFHSTGLPSGVPHVKMANGGEHREGIGQPGSQSSPWIRNVTCFKTAMIDEPARGFTRA